MKLKKTLAALAAAIALGGACSVAQAAITINNWTIDLGAIGNLGAGGDNWSTYGVYGTNGTLGINQLAFQALYHTIIAGAPLPGTLQHTDTLGAITQGVNQSGFVNQTTTGATLNGFINGFELTFATTTTQEIVSFDPVTGLIGTSHLGAGAGPNGVVSNGLLNIYADICSGVNNGDASLCNNTSTSLGGTGMQDGLLIASFAVVDANGTPTGSFNNSAGALDGQDDATFVMTFNYNGIVKKGGVALNVGETLAFTASNTDADNDNDGNFNTLPAGWGVQGLGACGTSAANNCGVENGTVVLAAEIPEPMTLALVGAALVGMGLSRRRIAK